MYKYLKAVFKTWCNFSMHNSSESFEVLLKIDIHDRPPLWSATVNWVNTVMESTYCLHSTHHHKKLQCTHQTFLVHYVRLLITQIYIPKGHTPQFELKHSCANNVRVRGRCVRCEGRDTRRTWPFRDATPRNLVLDPEQETCELCACKPLAL